MVFLSLLGRCIAEPHLCSAGLSIAIRLKFDAESGRLSLGNAIKYIFDTGGHFGNGISVFLRNEKVFVEVGSKGSVWQVSGKNFQTKIHSPRQEKFVMR